MALSGSFTGTTSNQTISSKITWSATQSITGNYSDVTATLYYSRTNTGYTTEGDWSGSITINGTTTSGSKHIVITYNSNTVAMTATTRVYHNADGTKSITISCAGAAPPSSLTSTSCSATVTLDTIPRTSSVTATDANIGSKPTITISRASTSFTHTLTYSFGGLTGTIATKTSSTSISSWTIPTSFYAKIPNSPSGECVITCTTYSGSTAIGTSTCVFNAIADKAICSPDVAVSSVDVNEESTTLTGNNKTIISGVSNLQVVTTAAAKNSASIKTISVYCGGNKQTGADVTFDGADSAVVYVIVTDSRGYSTRVDDDSLSLISYVVPTIVPTIYRDTPTGSTVTVSVKGKWFNGSFGEAANTLKISVKYKLQSAESYGSYYDVPITKNGNDYTATVKLSDMDYKEAYSFQLRLDDAIYTDANGYRDAKYAIVPLSKGIPVFDWGENDFQFNVPVYLPGGLLADYVIEEAYTGEWYCRKWAQGLSEAWYNKSLDPLAFTTKIADGLYSNDTYRGVSIDIPEGIFNYAPDVTTINACSNVVMQSQVGGVSTTWLTYRLWTSYSTTPSNIIVQIYVAGRWKE